MTILDGQFLEAIFEIAIISWQIDSIDQAHRGFAPNDRIPQVILSMKDVWKFAEVIGNFIRNRDEEFATFRQDNSNSLHFEIPFSE